MSRLSVYWPDEADSAVATMDEPMILPFPNSRLGLRVNFGTPDHGRRHQSKIAV